MKLENSEMLKIMVLGDRVLAGHSAYSKVGFELCTRSADLGYEVAHTPMGRVNQMGKYGFQKILIYPSGQDYFAEDVAISNYFDFKADLLITIKEPWVFNRIFREAVNFCPMAIIDHSPVSDAITARLTTAFRVIAVSRFGQIELRNKQIESTYVPHGVRTDVYRSLDPEIRKKCRRLFGLPEDDFIVGIIAMNRARKMIPHQLRAYKRFRELNPDVKTHMMLWTDVMPRSPPDDVTTGVSDVGVNLVPEIKQLGLLEAVIWPKWDQIKSIGGLPEYDPKGDWDMVKLYSSFDVTLLCSGGEGAGLPYLESQSCGVPCMGTNYAGATEYIGAGIAVPWNDYVIVNTPGVRYVMADVDKVAEGLTRLCNADREKWGRKCRAFAERYDWKVVVNDYWKPFLEECESELYPKLTKGGLTKWD
jgi:glycosyltransferase involved in cell wall biosynthesis